MRSKVKRQLPRWKRRGYGWSDVHVGDDIGLHIGTSGWSYDHWRGRFYPERLPKRKWLEFYAQHFTTVEIDNSFYRLPPHETFAAWRESTPEGFLFSVKASRYITHMKKLKGADEGLTRLISNARGLGEKLGPILFQLPATWHVNAERLAEFLALLPPHLLYAFEFRHPSWFTREVYALLSQRNVALCISDSPEWQTPFEVTASFTFIRLHGGIRLYASEYSEDELRTWAKILAAYREKGLGVFAYFNNDAYGYAAKNALRLKELLGAQTQRTAAGD